MGPNKVPTALVVAALLATTAQAQVQAPMLAYSARVGPEMSEVQTISVGGDGSVYVASLIKPAADAGANVSPKLFVAKLTPDGTSVQCSLSLDATAASMVVADDGAAILTGSTSAPSFPITTSAPRNSGRFLLRADLCAERVTYATWLPGSVRGTAVATDGAKIWVTTDDSLLRYDVGASEPSAQFSVNGIPGAIALGSGHLYVTGARGNGPFRAFLTSFEPATIKVEYDVAWGQGPVAAGTGLAAAADGSVWIAGPAIVEGLGSAPNYTAAGGVPYWSGSNTMLTRVAPGGTVAISRVVEQPRSSHHPAVGLGPDGRVWIAIPGIITISSQPIHQPADQWSVPSQCRRQRRSVWRRNPDSVQLGAGRYVWTFRSSGGCLNNSSVPSVSRRRQVRQRCGRDDSGPGPRLHERAVAGLRSRDPLRAQGSRRIGALSR